MSSQAVRSVARGVALAVPSLAGCGGGGGATDPAALEGLEWTLVFNEAREVVLPDSSWNVTTYNSGKGGVTTLVGGSELTLAFGDDGTVSGNAGVNTLNGPFTVDESAIEMGPLATTKMAGEPELMEQEQAFVKALEASTQWRVRVGTLELRDADASAMVFADPAR